jgi:hypothetical protein
MRYLSHRASLGRGLLELLLALLFGLGFDLLEYRVDVVDPEDGRDLLDRVPLRDQLLSATDDAITKRGLNEVDDFRLLVRIRLKVRTPSQLQTG